MQALTADPAIAQKMVVVLKTQGSLLMPWLDKVPALVEAWYPGQEDGNAVANVLFGLRNPSGKLPMTFGNSEREAAYSDRRTVPRPVGARAALGTRIQSTLLTTSRICRWATGGTRQRRDTAVPVRVRSVVHDVRVQRSVRHSRDRSADGRRRRWR